MVNVEVKKFVSLEVALKELEPYIRDGQHLQTGKPFAQLGGMRSREALANLLLCLVLNFDHGVTDFIFTSDPQGGDGIIWNAATEIALPTEHIIVPNLDGKLSDIEASILAAARQKQLKGGAPYASGKILVVLSNAIGAAWHPNNVAKQLAGKLDFIEVWAIALQRLENGDYIYGITLLKLDDGDAPTWLVRIRANFESWEIERIQ